MPAVHSSADRITPSPAAMRAGVIYGVSAYLFWGLVPLYFHLISHVPPATVLAHRVVWSTLVLAGLVAATGAMGEVRRIIGSGRAAMILLAATLLLATNWFTFIWAVANRMQIQASLGYFINPLVSVAFGAMFLGERFRRAQLLGIALATAGVAALTVSRGGLPWVALTLAFSWGGYGLLRKYVPGIAPIPGLAVETVMLLPLAGVYLTYDAAGGGWTPGPDTTTLLVALSGVITVIPLLWFGAAARRLRLSTLGILQYVGPTTQFLLAVLIMREPVRRGDLPGFVLIWLACVAYAVDSVLTLRRNAAAASTPAEIPA